MDRSSALQNRVRESPVRAKVEHPFRVIKRHFGYTKVRFRRRSKNTGQQAALFTLANSWGAGESACRG
ncbi:ISPssy, transposase [Pseudomonas ficuserectae]|uniref:ISPssy, transposase n=2 Tax=Pseudomonas amygdali TaxID=47877 RepID=A0A0P9VAR2_PSEA0|nr:ISPssy, transposase [Pseudomonas ficuserectae]KPX87688.1 ISPssy, transposase [Pseudomonas amygdali pv. mori]RMR23256.1 ISPssy, transposase [Pseudomonas amygdali pv. ulmi]RMQ41413.1 ISPssy, transposase [Pseudomonas amygdali pv. mori]RMR48762.1 ISPssy, transposase [Pseudomonas amygdali pv. mori]